MCSASATDSLPKRLGTRIYAEIDDHLGIRLESISPIFGGGILCQSYGVQMVSYSLEQKLRNRCVLLFFSITSNECPPFLLIGVTAFGRYLVCSGRFLCPSIADQRSCD